jgi:hypothetical protein
MFRRKILCPSSQLKTETVCYVSLKQWYLPMSLCSVKTHKNFIILTAVKTSCLTSTILQITIQKFINNVNLTSVFRHLKWYIHLRFWNKKCCIVFFFLLCILYVLSISPFLILSPKQHSGQSTNCYASHYVILSNLVTLPHTVPSFETYNL